MFSPLPKNVKVQLMVALPNFKLAGLVCSYLIEQKANARPIPTYVRMDGIGASVEIPGAHCGFFSTPIIHCAALDVRRTLAFLMLKFDSATATLVSLTKNQYLDDFSLSNLGVLPPTPNQMLGLATKVTGKASVKCLNDMVVYSNKGLAHFSKKDENPTMENIVDACAIMEEAVMVFLYDATGTPRPNLRIQTTGNAR